MIKHGRHTCLLECFDIAIWLSSDGMYTIIRFGETLSVNDLPATQVRLWFGLILLGVVDKMHKMLGCAVHLNAEYMLNTTCVC